MLGFKLTNCYTSIHNFIQKVNPINVRFPNLELPSSKFHNGSVAQELYKVSLSFGYTWGIGKILKTITEPQDFDGKDAVAQKAKLFADYSPTPWGSSHTM